MYLSVFHAIHHNRYFPNSNSNKQLYYAIIPLYDSHCIIIKSEFRQCKSMHVQNEITKLNIGPKSKRRHPLIKKEKGMKGIRSQFF